MSEELKPCPFCKVAPRVEQFSDFPAFMEVFRVICPSCRCYVDRAGKTEAIAAWNRRPVEDGLRDRIAELEGALRTLIGNSRKGWHEFKGSPENFERAMKALEGKAE